MDGRIDVRFGQENGQTEAHPCTGVFQTCCTRRSDEPNIPKVEIANGCGYRNEYGVGFRILGLHNESQFGEFPWSVAVLKKDQGLENALDAYTCSGSLIHPSVVLTAAHCISGKEPGAFTIRAGEWDAQTTEEIFPHQDRNVFHYIVHEQYSKGRMLNDVALLFLSEPVVLAENVNTVCLPPHNQEFDGAGCYVSSWGKDLFGVTGKSQAIMKRVELLILPNDSCEAQLKKTRLGTRFVLHNSFICGGGDENLNTCNADGGSPLICPIPGTENRFYQAGTFSWGVGCKEQPGKFENVTTP